VKISYSLRAFGIYFIILGTLIWFTLDNAIERLNDGMRQSAESVLVDVSNILASFIEDELHQNSAQNTPNTDQLNRVFTGLEQRALAAQIYQVVKTSVDSQVYVTDQKGIVIYDSNGQNLGKDFSKWRDVRFTLEGKYGARTSYIYPDQTEPDDPQAMVIAAPIKYNGGIVGVLSVLKPIDSFNDHLVTESAQLQRYAFALLLLALVIGYLLSLWFTYSLNKIANYARDTAEAKKVDAPTFHDTRLAALSESISYMRSQLDGKEYVENYIHSLTHELKTPITSIQGAVELMTEDMPSEDREKFLNNINTSNQRMSRLVERMLSLAKLESLTKLVATSEFDVIPTIKRLVQERSPTIDSRELKITYPQQTTFVCHGDKVLISQAIANLLDNAIRFCSDQGHIDISLSYVSSNVSKNLSNSDANHNQITLFNQGEPIPEFALIKLYDRFFSLPSNVNEYAGVKSTGLGLSFVKEIMKLHKGKISVANSNNGVVATLAWPN